MKRRTRKQPPKQQQALLVRFPRKQHRELKNFSDETGESMNNVVLLSVARTLREQRIDEEPHLRLVETETPEDVA